MTSNFQSWEKDPLFFAAEQVQDAADRLGSAYRAWMRAKSLSLNTQDSSILGFCRRELSTALGIAKGQLEEFEKEVLVLSTNIQQQQQQQRDEDDTSQRHRQFIDAISNQLSCIKKVLLSSKDEKELKVLPAVCLRQEESDQFAHFLRGSRLNTSENTKDMLGKCTGSGKGYTATMTAYQSATSMSSSSLCGGKALFESLNECLSSPDNCTSVDTHERGISKDYTLNRPEVYWTSDKNSDSLYMNGSQIEVGPTCAASDLLIGDCHLNGGTCMERTSGHRRSPSLGGGFGFCTERANGNLGIVSVETGASCYDLSSRENKPLPNNVTGALSNFWSSVSKASFLSRVGGTPSIGLKRWKDGECNAIDPCEILHTDLEQGCSIFLCQEGVMQTSHHFPRGIYFSWLIRATSATLAVVGLVGLYLH